MLPGTANADRRARFEREARGIASRITFDPEFDGFNEYCSPQDDQHGRFSPTVEWIAYTSDESGQPEIYVQSSPTLQSAAPVKWQVSKNGGVQPLWGRDGNELYYIALDEKLMSAPVQSGSGFSTGAPVELFQTRITSAWDKRYEYTIALDGQHILINSIVADEVFSPIHVILNWKP